MNMAPKAKNVDTFSEYVATGDITNVGMDSYIVVGFFTPDYREMAEKFSANLKALDMPHHLFAMGRDEWDRAVMLKSTVVLRSMNLYPNRAIVLSDVDCIIRGQIRPAMMDTDVSLHVRVKWGRKRNIWASTRFVAFAPTQQARKLVRAWHSLCIIEIESKTIRNNEEHCLMMALSRVGFLRIGMLPSDYAAHEVDEVPECAVVVHDSKHDEVRAAWSLRREIKRARRAIISRIVGIPYDDWKYGIIR